MESEQEIKKHKDGTSVRLTLTMTRQEYENLLVTLGMVMGTISRQGFTELSWKFVAFINKLNADNPDFHPYQLPEDFVSAQHHGGGKGKVPE